MSLKDLRTFILEDDFKITYLNNKIDIINYVKIEHFSSDKIIINYNKGTIYVIGNYLYVSKLMNDELLIEGKIERIEFR
ncbi:MAG: YabP/YqfC family sporulation protein [Bacilli bacterium]